MTAPASNQLVSVQITIMWGTDYQDIHIQLHMCKHMINHVILTNFNNHRYRLRGLYYNIDYVTYTIYDITTERNILGKFLHWICW